MLTLVEIIIENWRRVLIRGFLLFLLLMTQPAHSQVEQTEVDTGLLTALQSLLGSEAGGTMLQKICTDDALVATCYGYVWGVMFAYDLSGLRFHCAPNDIDSLKLLFTIQSWMNEHPSLVKNMSPPMIIISALREAYPQTPISIPYVVNGEVESERRATVCEDSTYGSPLDLNDFYRSFYEELPADYLMRNVWLSEFIEK